MSAAASPHRIVIAAFAPVQLLDVSGPMDVFSVANEISIDQGRAAPYRVQLAAPQAGPVACSSGVALQAQRGLFDPGLKADTLLLAGGSGTREVLRDPALVTRLRRLCERVPRVGSICTGAFALAATGLLDGRRATTHWAHFDELATTFPRVDVERDALYVIDGKYHSTAGITAGMDYALALVEHDHGRALALAVARQLVMFLKRPGGQAQFSAELAAQTTAAEPDRFAALTRWMGAHLQDDLSVAALAARAAMSPRHFARRFAEAMNATPAQYVQALRLDAARRMLTESRHPIGRIAERCGFASEEAMRACFQRHQGVAPSEFRARFRSTV
ncbi:MAG: GlxA family transcriptional regulator [Gammaproteobacteria bacterium]